jgi:hypothetical protein
MLATARRSSSSETFHGVTHPDDRARSSDLKRSLVCGGISSVRFEKRYVHRQGQVYGPTSRPR